MSDDMNQDRLKSLAGLSAPAPSEAARQRALASAAMAFEAAKADAPKKIVAPTQGPAKATRLNSIIASLKGKWIMDLRLPIGTVAVALLLLPLGYQLYNSTALTLPGFGRATDEPSVIGVPGVNPQVDPRLDAEARNATVPANEVAAPRTEIAQAHQPEVKQEAPAATTTPMPTDADAAPGEADLSIALPVAPEPALSDAITAPSPPSTVTTESEIGRSRQQPLGGAATNAATMQQSAGIVADSAYAPMPSPMPSIMAQPTAPSGDEFTGFEESRLKVVADEPVSTFSIDVDTASYSYVRRMVEDGYIPEPDAVRLEEMINYFPYDYPAPVASDVPFKPTMAIFPTPWNKKTQLLHIGIKGYVPPVTEDKASNLVFLIDTSGSMDEPDKLPLLKRAFALLVDQLSANDTVSIVVYAGSAGVVLEPTVATDKAKILSALDNLAAGGSTAGAEGIELAYRLAEQARIEDGTNRVILATDGDFNVGIDDPEALEDFIKQKRDSGVTLSVLGFGQGNLDDATMQALAQNGNGNASYISSFREAQKVLVEEGGSTLEMIAKDVKIQVEFNPAMVSEYRLIGYETRALNREDFNNDTVDAGDIGAGHTVTAIYEITPAGSGAELVDPLRYGAEQGADPAAVATANAPTEIAFLKMRYKLPDEDISQLIEMPVTADLVKSDIAQATPDMRFAAAVAAFGQKLRGSNYGQMRWDDIRALAQSGRGEDESGYRAEFMQLLRTAEILKPDADLPEPAQGSVAE